MCLRKQMITRTILENLKRRIPVIAKTTAMQIVFAAMRNGYAVLNVHAISGTCYLIIILYLDPNRFLYSCKKWAEACHNPPFRYLKKPKMIISREDGRGWGLMADQVIEEGDFVIDYTGEGENQYMHACMHALVPAPCACM